MKSLMIPVAALLGATLAVGAQAQQTSPQTSPRSAPSSATSAISTPDYVQKQARGDMFEIEAGKLAQQKAQSTDIRSFGQMMVEDHTLSKSNMQAAMKAGNVKATAPKTLDSRLNQALEQLKNTPSNQFDQAYYQSQVQGHREMLALNQGYSQSGDNAALKEFSQQAIPVIENHLGMLQQMAANEAPPGAGAGSNARTTSGGVVGTSGAPAAAGTRGSSGQMDVLDPGTGASSGGGAGQQVIQQQPIGPGGPRQFNQPGRDDGGLRDD
jgi:putative membrane protein